MFKVNNLIGNDNITCIASGGPFEVIEYQKDMSIGYDSAVSEYFAHKMNIKRRQVVCDLSEGSVIIEPGAMQWTVGNVVGTTGIKGAGDLAKKMFKGAVTQETAVLPEYKGNGILVLEPTYDHLTVVNVSEWPSGIVLGDGMFKAASGSLENKLVMRKTVSSMAFGHEGLFNMCLKGDGYAVLESSVPKTEMIEIELENDELRVDGNQALCWSASLNFTVEKSTRSLLGSAVAGEGLVNVFRGSGRVLLAPVDRQYKE